MKQKELNIISQLRKDARSSLAAISEKVEVPISTIYDKICKMHKFNLIKKFTVILDFPKLGFHYHAKIAIKVPKKQTVDIIKFLKENSCVNSLHEINGGFTVFIETLHTDLKQFIDFKDCLYDSFDILEMHEYQIINDIETKKFMNS